MKRIQSPQSGFVHIEGGQVNHSTASIFEISMISFTVFSNRWPLSHISNNLNDPQHSAWILRKVVMPEAIHGCTDLWLILARKATLKDRFFGFSCIIIPHYVFSFVFLVYRNIMVMTPSSLIRAKCGYFPYNSRSFLVLELLRTRSYLSGCVPERFCKIQPMVAGFHQRGFSHSHRLAIPVKCKKVD